MTPLNSLKTSHCNFAPEHLLGFLPLLLAVEITISHLLELVQGLRTAAQVKSHLHFGVGSQGGDFPDALFVYPMRFA